MIKYFIFFSVIQIIEILISYTLGRNLNSDDNLMVIIDYVSIFFPIIITGILIYIFKNGYKIKFYEKGLILLGILLVGFITVLIVNILNIYNRDINNEDIVIGIYNSLKNRFITFVIGLPILTLINSRLDKNNQNLNEIEKIGTK